MATKISHAREGKMIHLVQIHRMLFDKFYYLLQ